MVIDPTLCGEYPHSAESIFELFYKLEQNPNIGQRFLIVVKGVLQHYCNNTETVGMEGTNLHRYVPCFLNQRSLSIKGSTNNLILLKNLKVHIYQQYTT